MAIISIDLFANNEIESETAKTIKFDGLITATEENSNTVTRRPVEEGFDTTDAIHINPKRVDFDVIITDTPQSILDRRSLTNLPNILGLKLVKSHTKQQLARLQAISDNKETVTIKTKYNEYVDYFLEGFRYTEDNMQGLIISFSITENRTDAEDTVRNVDDSLGLFS